MALSSIGSTTLFAGLAVLLLVYLAVDGVVQYAKLRQFKGPRSAGFNRAWLFREEVAGRLATSQRDVLRKYGSPARIGPNLLVTDDPELIRHMSAPGSRWTRGSWYEGMKLDPRQDTVFSTRDEKLHAQLRTKEAGGYHGRDIVTLESDIDARIGELLELTKNTYNGIPMDVSTVIRFFTLDVLSTVAFGLPFGFMAADQDLWGYNEANSAFTLIMALQTNHPWLRRLLAHPWVQKLAAPKITDKTGMGPALAHAKKAVDQRFGADATVKKDMLGHFVAQGLSPVQCEAEAFLQIIAGSDSTTGVLRCLFYLLAGSPSVYIRLQREVDDAVASGVRRPVVKYTETMPLPYLKAVIWETIRMYPPLFGLKSKVTHKGDTFKGIYFPPGTEVCDCNVAVQRRTDIFGEDADIFRPERLMEGSDEQRRQRLQTIDTSFGAGRFLCLGKHIAMMEMHKAVFEFMSAFEFQLADPMTGIETFMHGIHQSSKMFIVVRPRR